MVEVYLISTGLIFFGWLYALVRQTQKGVAEHQSVESRPIVPVNLLESDEAVLVAADRGRIVFANEQARRWFEIDGGTPTLNLVSQFIQPADALHDLVAEAGHASFRLAQRRIEAVSHTIPGEDGQRMVIVMRELTAAGTHVYTEFDPLRALAILGDISDAVGTGADLYTTIESVLRSVEQSITYDAAQILIWDSDTDALHPMGQRVVRTPTGTLIPPSQRQRDVYKLGEGYSGWIAMYRQPLLIGDVSARADVVAPPFDAEFQSYLGVPLMVADRFIGTLEMIHRDRNAFRQRELSLLQTIAGQVAATLDAALVYREQLDRVAELSGLQQIAEAMSLLGTPNDLYGQLTQRIAALIGAELCGVLIYDERDKVFRSQLPFYGVPDSLILHYRLSLIPDSELYSIWWHQPWWYSNDPDSEMIRAMGFEEMIAAITLRSMALVPMIVGARRIGLLMVANRSNVYGFSESDMHVLMSFASQAAVVAESARMYADEQRRTRELGGLQAIAQAMGVLRSPDELYAQITERIALLMGVEMCGVLLFDPKDRVLVSQQPFYGLADPESVDFYQLPSPLGGPVAKLWLDHDYWFTNDLRRDAEVGDTDFARMGAVVGFNQTVIAALVVGGNRLGIIQAATKTSGAEFNEDDARILSIFAGQAAILIDNARLYREMQRRTHEAEGLRAITEIASTSTSSPLDELIERVLIAVANLLESDVVLLGLVEEQSGQLVIAPEMLWGTTLNEPISIDAYASGFEESVLVSRRPFATNNVAEDRRILPQYRDIAQQLDLHSLIVVPLVIQDRSIGELCVGNRSEGEGFTASRVQLLTSIGTQLAAMLDRVRLYEETDQDIRARLQELDALGRVTRELSQTVTLDRILDVIRQEALRSTAAMSASIVLLVSRADSWDEDQQPAQLEQRYGEETKLTDLSPVELAAIERAEVVNVADYYEASLEPHLPKTRSALVVPVLFGGEVLGLIHLWSINPGAFDERVTSFVESLADQAAIAIGNARRYQDQMDANRQLQRRAEQMGRIFDLGEMFRQGASLPETLARVAQGVQETVGFNLVLVSLVDEDQGVMIRTAQAGLSEDVFAEMRQTAPPLHQARSLMQDVFRISNSYFLPSEGTAELTADLPTYQALTESVGAGPRSWQPEDLMLVPMYGSRGALLGVMSVDEPRSSRRPDLTTVEALEIFANQAAFSIENYRLLERIRLEAEAARRERDRLAQLHMVASEIQSAPDVPSRLQVVADGIRQAGWGQVVITLRDEKLEPTALINAGYDQDENDQLADQVVSGKRWRAWLNDLSFHDLKLGSGYYLRYDRRWVREHILRGTLPDPETVPDDAWHPQDVFYLPLVGQDQKRIIGIIAMRRPMDGRVPTESSLQPFDLFASQAAAAIETTRLYLETVRAAEQEARLNEMMEVVSGSLDPETVIVAIGRGLQQVIPFTRMSVALYDNDQGHFDMLRASILPNLTVQVETEEPLGVESTATGQAYRERKAKIYRLEDDPAWRKYSDLLAWYDSGERSSLIVPMIAGGQAVGVLHLGSELANVYGFQENEELIQRLANLSAVALDNARLFQRAREREEFLAAMQRVSASLNQIFDLGSVLRTICDESLPILGVEGAYVWLQVGDELLGIAASGAAQESFFGLSVPLSDKQILISRVASERRPIYVNGLQDRTDRAQIVPLEDLQSLHALLAVPLLREDQVLGTLMLVEADRDANFTDVDVDQAQSFAVQAAIAIENARLFEESEQRALELDAQARRLALINRVSARLARSTGVEDIYDTSLREMQEAMGAQFGGLVLYDEDDQTGRLALDTHPQQRAGELRLSLKDNQAVDYVRREHKPLVSEDVLSDPRFATDVNLLRERGTKSMMLVPLIVNDQTVGSVGLDFTEQHVFTDAEIEMAETIASQVSVALEKAHLLDETQRRAAELDDQAQRLALINRVSARLAETLDPTEIYRIVVGELAETLQVQFGGLILFEGNVGRLAINYPLDQPGPQVEIGLEGNLSIEQVQQTHQPLVSTDVMDDPLFENAWDALAHRGTKSLIIAPLLSGEQVIGTIGLDSTIRREFTDAEIELVKIIAGQASLAVEKARLYNETLGLTIFNQAVVESIQQGIIVLDKDLEVRRVNRFMVDRYGWETEAVGKSLFVYRPDYEEFLREPIAVALGMGEQQARYEIEQSDPSGERSIRNYYVYPMLEGRSVTGIVLLVEDVSERARLEADLQERAVQMSALTEVSGQITSTLEPDQVIDLILDALRRVVPFDGVSLWLRAPDREELNIAAARGYKDAEAPDVSELLGLTVEIPFSPLFAEMAEKAQVINVGDVGAGDARFPYGDASIYKNWLGAPMISAGNVVGVVALEKREAYYYTDLHEQLVLTFANQAAIALDNAQLFQETRSRAMALDEQAQRLALLNRVSLALAQTLDLENIFEIALRETAITLGVTEGQALQIDNINHLARVIVEFPRGDAPPTEIYSVDDNEAIERVRRGLIPLVIENVRTDALGGAIRPMMRRDDVESTMLVPLVVGGEVIGILRLDAVGEARVFPDSQTELAQTIATQAAIAVQNASLYEQSANRTRELETLFESAQATAVTLDLDEVIRRVTMQMLSALRADACTVFMWNDVGNVLEVRGDISARPDDVPPDQPGDIYSLDDYPLREQVLRDRRLLVVRDGEELPEREARIMAQHRATSRMLIPLVVNEISIGLVEIETLDPMRYFKPEDRRMARTLASQAAISIENARLQTETRRTVEELYIINDMSSSLSSAPNVDSLLDVIAMQLPSLTDAEYLYVALYDTNTQELTFPLALRVSDDVPEEMPARSLGSDEFSIIVRRQSPLLLAGDMLDVVRSGLGIETVLPSAACFLGVPLFAGDELIGVMAVRHDQDPIAFGHNEQRILTTVGSQLGVAIQSARLFEQTVEQAEVLDQRVRERTTELEQERQYISTLYQITTELVTSLDMDRLLNRALEMVARAVGATQGAILGMDMVSERLNFRARFGVSPGTNEGSSPVVGLNEGLAGWAIHAHQNVIVNDVQQDPRWLRLSDADDVPRAAMATLIEANEDILGVLMLYSGEPDAFNQDQLRLVTAAANQVANAMNNAELYTLIRDQAERLGDMLRQEQVEATKSDSILESVADGVMVADETGQIIVFNQTAENILGIPAAQVLNQPIASISGVYGAEPSRWAETVNQWTREPDQHMPGEYLEDRLTLDDGRVISVRLSPVYMGDQFLGTVSIFRDITREVEVDRLKSEFVATVSHELRTPMTSIKGYADLLLLGAAGEVTEQQQRFLETIKQNADRLSILVNDLLDISRIDQGRIDLNMSKVSVAELFDRVANHLRGRSEEEKRDLDIKIEVAEDADLTLWGDYDKVAQILTNLADNAFNYTPDEGQITLRAVPHPEHSSLILSVADTGIGILPEARDRVFERFFRGDESQDLVMDTPGTGLGLAIVKEFVDMHGGDIWFDSTVGEGTVFYVELPTKSPVSPSDDKRALESHME